MALGASKARNPNKGNGGARMNENAHIEKLKNIRAPWWSRLLGNWRAWRAARAARKKMYHIATVNIWMRTIVDKQIHCSWVHFYETGAGKRSYTYQQGKRPHRLETTHLYHHLVIPWLHHKLSNDDLRRQANLYNDEPTGDSVWRNN